MMRTEVFIYSLCIAVLALTSAAASDGYGTPLNISLSLSRPEVRVGEEFEAVLTLSINSPWYVYGDVPPSGPEAPLKLQMILPDGIQSIENNIWQPPRSAPMRIYKAGNYAFRFKARATAGADAAVLRTIVTYQTCNPDYCLPPQDEEVTVKLRILTDEKSTSMPATDADAPRIASPLRTGI